MTFISDATRARSRRDKNPTSNPPGVSRGTPADTCEVQHVSESSRATPWLVGLRPPHVRTYVTTDALRIFIASMIDILLQQVTDQAKKATEGTSSLRQSLALDGEVYGEERIPFRDARPYVNE